MSARPEGATALPPSGNGGSSEGAFPCLMHSAQIAHNAEVQKQILDAVRALSRRLDDEAATRARWAGDIEYALLEQSAATKRLTEVVGTPPDPSTGAPGSGMRAQLALGINHMTRLGVRREMPSLLDEESEVTGNYDRETLVAMKRHAERTAIANLEARAAADTARRKAIIAAWGSTIVLIIGAIGAVLAQLL